MEVGNSKAPNGREHQDMDRKRRPCRPPRTAWGGAFAGKDLILSLSAFPRPVRPVSIRNACKGLMVVGNQLHARLRRPPDSDHHAHGGRFRPGPGPTGRAPGLPAPASTGSGSGRQGRSGYRGVERIRHWNSPSCGSGSHRPPFFQDSLRTVRGPRTVTSILAASRDSGPNLTLDPGVEAGLTRPFLSGLEAWAVNDNLAAWAIPAWSRFDLLPAFRPGRRSTSGA